MDDQQKMDMWSGFFVVDLIIMVIDFFIMINQEDGSSGAIITGMILIFGISFGIIIMVQINIYNAKAKGMSAGEYLADRFENAIPETKEVFGITDTSHIAINCPYCNSVNVKKISTINRAASTWLFGLASSKIGKQWHCKNCKSNF